MPGKRKSQKFSRLKSQRWKSPQLKSPPLKSQYCKRSIVEFKGRLVWNIGGFTTYFLLKNEATAKSPPFRISGCETDFRVAVYPRGLNEDANYISLYLHASRPGDFSCEFSLLSASGLKMYQKTVMLVNQAIGGIEKYISLTDLQDQKTLLLPDDELTLCCIMTMTKEIETSGEQDPSGDGETSGDPKAKRFKKDLTKNLQWDTVSDELKQLYDDEESKDFVLKAGRLVMPVHKRLLVSRSPVFKSMLESMVDCNTNEVVLSDLESDVLGELVHFMYKDKLHSNNTDFIMKLLVGADKYDVASLKARCAEHLSDNVSANNVFRMLMVADACNVGELTELCMRIIKREMGNLPMWISQLNECKQALPVILKLLKESRSRR